MARWIIGADGMRSVVADAVGSTIERRGTGATAVMYGYWSGLATDDYLWIFRPGACAGLIPTNGGHTCVFAASTPARVGKGGIDTLHDVVGAADPALGARLASTPPMQRRADLRRGGRLHASAVGTRLGARRRCGLLEGPPRRARAEPTRSATPRLLSRAIIAITVGGAPESDALDHYHRTRDRLSLPLFDVVDTIAAMRWTDAEIPGLLRQLSSTMSDEVEFVARFDDEPAVSGASL